MNEIPQTIYPEIIKLLKQIDERFNDIELKQLNLYERSWQMKIQGILVEIGELDKAKLRFP